MEERGRCTWPCPASVMNIDHEEQRSNLNELTSEEQSITTTTTTESPEPEISTPPDTPAYEGEPLEEETDAPERLTGIRLFRFRFHLANFRPGRTLLQRRFSIAEGAALFMVAIVASRGLGVIRQSMFNAVFSVGPSANAYYAAARLPDLLFSLIAGGALSHAFIPVFTSYDKEQGREAAWRLSSLVFNLLLVTLTAALLAGELLAPAYVNHLLVPGYDPATQAMTTTLTRIMLLQALFLGLGTIITALLNSKRQFFLPAVAVAIYNIGPIVGLLFTLLIPSIGIYGPTCGIVVAALIHVAVQIPALLKQSPRYFFAWSLKDPGLRQVIRLLGPNIASVAIASVSFTIDTAFVSYLADKGSLAALHNAYTIFALPVALLAQATAQSVLPRLSSLAASGSYTRLRQLAIKILASGLCLGIPTALLLCVLGRPLIHVVFQHGAFGKHAANLTGAALIGYAVGLPAVIAIALMMSTFYSFKDALTPFITNVFNFGIHLALILLLLGHFKGPDAILAIPLAASGSATIEALLLGLLLFWRLRAKRERMIRRGNCLE